jgi:enamine deaminase RidA (YjgF/YER057c/UK114 family)
MAAGFQVAVPASFPIISSRGDGGWFFVAFGAGGTSLQGSAVDGSIAMSILCNLAYFSMRATAPEMPVQPGERVTRMVFCGSGAMDGVLGVCGRAFVCAARTIVPGQALFVQCCCMLAPQSSWFFRFRRFAIGGRRSGCREWAPFIMSAEEKLVELGLHLPPVPTPVAAYVNAVRTGDLLYLSGGLPFDPERRFNGKVPSQVSVEMAKEAARRAMLDRLAVVRNELGSLDKVKRIVSVQGFVNSDPDFGDQPMVINGASELLIEIFGEEIGMHSRVAVGAVSLPLHVSVEIAMVVEIE